MAWYCSGSTNLELVENLFKVGLIKNERVKNAMIGVSLPFETNIGPGRNPKRLTLGIQG